MTRSTRSHSLAGALLLACLTATTGCYTFRFGSHDTTVVVVAPEEVPAERRVRGVPKVPAVFSGTWTAITEAEPVYDENATYHYAGLLRKAHVFDGVHAIDVSTHPVNEYATVRMERWYRENDHTGGNLAKAALVPGLTSYDCDLAGTMRLIVTFPAEPGHEPETVTYEATTAARRQYYTADRRDGARRVLYEDVDETNFLNLLHQLRAEPRLFRAGP
jgi:hypothetical protein